MHICPLRRADFLSRLLSASMRTQLSYAHDAKIDGLMKTEFQTREGARAGAKELKKRFSRLRVGIFDAETKTREEIKLSAV